MTWAGKRVLVTGAGGFIGSHLAERLVEAGADVRALVRYNGRGTRGWLDASPLRAEMEIVAGDICDRDCTARIAQGRAVIFHLAALIAIPYSYSAPGSYVRANIEGTLNLLQAAREHAAERFVQTSTSEVYGTAQFVPISEAHPLQGQSPYSASKIGADKIAEAFHLSFSVPVTTVRPFNTFGPRQSARAIIPTIISQCLAGEKVRLGSLTPTRDLNYVDNTVDGFLLAGAVPEAVGQTFNIGSGQEISMGDLAHLIARIIGRHLQIECDAQRLRPARSEVERLLADSTLARAVLCWEPKISLEEGLTRTIAWMRAHPGGYQPDAYQV